MIVTYTYPFPCMHQRVTNILYLTYANTWYMWKFDYFNFLIQTCSRLQIIQHFREGSINKWLSAVDTHIP